MSYVLSTPKFIQESIVTQIKRRVQYSIAATYAVEGFMIKGVARNFFILRRVINIAREILATALRVKPRPFLGVLPQL